jgi:hypothetical protein
MAKPPPATPSSDIEGVNRDARIGTPSRQPEPDPGAQLKRAQDESVARPEGDAPDPAKGG